MTKTKDKKEEKLNQVFQGRYMREGRSFLELIFYTYAKPLIESAMTQQIRFEQYGELPDRLKIKYEEEKLEAAIQGYIKKNPYDRLAFMKGMLEANKYQLAKFFAVRCILTM